MNDASDLGDRFPALSRLRLFRRAREVPFIQQLTPTECGAACLAMVLAYHGKDVPVGEVRDTTGIDRDGTTALGILTAAEWYGLRGRGVAIDVAALPFLDPATILHWEFNHFVVFVRLRRGGVEIVDPALGRRFVPMTTFRRSFTGVALLLEPGDDFSRSRRGGLVAGYARQLFDQPRLWASILVTSTMVQLFALAVPLLTGLIVDRVVPFGDAELLSVLIVGVLSLAIFQWLAVLVRGHLLLQLRTRLDAAMTLRFFDHLIRLPYEFFQRRSAGDLMMRLNSNATVREILTSGALSGLLDGVLALLYLVILLIASPARALVAVILAALQIMTFVATRSRQRELNAQGLAAQARSQSYQVELFTGIETIKAFGAEQRAAEHWSQLFVETLNVSLDRGRVQAHIDAWTTSLRLAAPLCVLSFGATLVLDGSLTLGAMLALNAVAIGFLGPLANLLGTATQLQLLSSYLERIDDVLRAPTEQDLGTVRRAPTLSGRVEFNAVTFQYGPAAPPVLKGLSFAIEPGQLVAVVGRSGSGKSTLARLLAGLYRPTAGRILYDGEDLAELELRSVRRQLGFVPQSPAFFGQSIRANIALADPTAPLAAVVAAARMAQIHDEIAAMPMKYETLLLDGAASLSGGQRQRLALARALLTEPVILLLDEATSSLDTITEEQVARALTEQRCTRIVIAHRMSTVAAADQILVLEDGALAERGNHAELIARGGVYAELVAGQRLGDGPPRGAAS